MTKVAKELWQGSVTMTTIAEGLFAVLHEGHDWVTITIFI